jgi:hypothetical protein
MNRIKIENRFVMRIQYLLFLVISFFYSCTIENRPKTNLKQAKVNRTESIKEIDWSQFQNDLQFVDEGENLPLGFGVFPVTEYETSGNGNVEQKLTIDGDEYIQQSVFVYQGDYNTSFFENVKDPDQELVFFTLLVKSIHQDTTNDMMSSSRNHPTYLSQGLVKVEDNQKIKWVALHNSSENNDMAIVNMKYFDLSKGRLVIVQPRTDGSLRFEQITCSRKVFLILKSVFKRKVAIGLMKRKTTLKLNIITNDKIYKTDIDSLSTGKRIRSKRG